MTVLITGGCGNIGAGMSVEQRGAIGDIIRESIPKILLTCDRGILYSSIYQDERPIAGAHCSEISTHG